MKNLYNTTAKYAFACILLTTVGVFPAYGRLTMPEVISIDRTGAELETIFEDITAATNMIFLHNPDSVKDKRSQASAPTELSFNGRVTDAKRQKPIAYASVIIQNLNLWAVTNQNGDFSIPRLMPGDYTFEVYMLGYKKYSGSINLQSKEQFATIELSESSLALSEIIVTAQEKRMGSVSIIDESAIQHIQAKSVEDMLQLVPGNLTSNPSLNTVGQAYVREISPDSNNSLGMAVVVDGAPLSNDANMQAMSSAKTGTRLDLTGSGSDQTVAGKGVDLRLISPDNIESVEVVRGIPSVEYGNLNSGLMIIKTRAGATPLEIKAKTDESSKLLYAGKGFVLGEKAGAVNLSVDYTQSYYDLRIKYQGFERITANLGYSNTFMPDKRPLSFNLRVALFNNINERRSDPQLLKTEKIKNTNQGIRVNIDGEWSLNTMLVSNLGYSLMYSESHQNDYYNLLIRLQTGGITPVGTSLSEGEFKAHYVNSTYYSEYSVDGRPRDIFAQLKATKTMQFSSKSFMSIKLGADFKYAANNGDGLVIDPMFPPNVSDVQTVRPRTYKDIPAMNTVSLFVEDKTKLPIGTTSLTLLGGVRYSTLILQSYGEIKRHNLSVLEPRINAEFNILNRGNNNFLDDFSIVGGYGIAAKMPTLLHLYPDKAYYDRISFNNYGNDVPEAQTIAVMTTKIVQDTSDPDIKPSVGRKAEVGISFRKNRIRGNVTFFREKHTNAFTFMTEPVVMSYRLYQKPADAVDSYIHKDGALYYVTGGVEYPVAYEERTRFESYSKPTNNATIEKTGIEYSFGLGQIRALMTSLEVNGAWFRVKSKTTKDSYAVFTNTYQGLPFPYVAIYSGGTGNIANRVNSTFRFVTHIPQLKMIFTTTTEVVWLNTSRAIAEDSDGNNLYSVVDNNGKNEYWISPVAFRDHDGNTTVWTSEHQNSSEAVYSNMIIKYTNERYFDVERLPVYATLNFRLTKEFGKIMNFSFIANNFLMFRKFYKLTTSKGSYDLYLPLYFGAEITIRI